jgi:hypothetical protein
MALIHRWMLNMLQCQQIGLPFNSNIEHGCYYTGPGKTTTDRLDVGKDLLVDRFEIGVDNTSRYGQNPNTNFSQLSAWNACQAQNNIGLAGITGSFAKRLLSKREFTAASIWPITLTDSEIQGIESGTTGSAECNGNGSAVEPTGQNDQCVSFFGIENMAGNAWEFVSDRIYNGFGVSDDSLKLDPGNDDLNDVDFTRHTNKYVDDYPCFTPVWGMPFFEPSGAGCGNYNSVSSMGSAAFHDNYFFAPGTSGLQIGAMGGGFSTNQYSGRLTTGWLPATFKAAARCGFGVP